MKRRVPTTIRGVEYPSRYAAAKALGVSATAIYEGIEHGYLDRVGLDGAGRSEPVSIRGRVFPSQRAAARFFKVHQSVISRRLDRGTLDGLPEPYEVAA